VPPEGAELETTPTTTTPITKNSSLMDFDGTLSRPSLPGFSHEKEYYQEMKVMDLPGPPMTAAR